MKKIFILLGLMFIGLQGFCFDVKDIKFDVIYQLVAGGSAPFIPLVTKEHNSFTMITGITPSASTDQDYYNISLLVIPQKTSSYPVTYTVKRGTIIPVAVHNEKEFRYATAGKWEYVPDRFLITFTKVTENYAEIKFLPPEEEKE